MARDAQVGRSHWLCPEAALYQYLLPLPSSCSVHGLAAGAGAGAGAAPPYCGAPPPYCAGGCP
eukprot:CAMPEP_0171624404 /NCGR_PEP_ID=MMETSP0990-20121206/18600_1 /TAXON_ID=483369 /ORGANISM="non described non described, Strain CCMP2098" /LENGTH=62 /DNA_ID=CAMNT_0012190949 /DNA_START=735 /DNA_END=923 /DNA_ORIENTATION=-